MSNGREAESDPRSAGSGASAAGYGGAGEPTAILPETAAQLVEMEQLQQALAKSEERAKNHWEQYLRAVADMENLRKRTQREADMASRQAIEKFALELLPVKDSLELATVSSATADPEALRAGQEATLQLLSKAFEKLGIVELDPLGEPFDPNRHEAIMAQHADSAEPDSVLQVVQRGYEWNGRLLRPARVIVAKAPET